MRISDWSSDVCSSDLVATAYRRHRPQRQTRTDRGRRPSDRDDRDQASLPGRREGPEGHRILTAGAPPMFQKPPIESNPFQKTGVMLCGHGSRDARAVAEFTALATHLKTRTEERRVGKECVRPWKSRWSAYHKTKK